MLSFCPRDKYFDTETRERDLMRQVQVLPLHESKQFDSPPSFSKEEKQHYFTLPPSLATKIITARSPINKIGIVIQYGYFKATGKFYVAKKYLNSDIRFTSKMLGVNISGSFHDLYPEKTRYNHKVMILESLGYKLLKEEASIFNDAISNLVCKHTQPRKILFSVIDLLRSKKIEVPNYDTFAKAIANHFYKFESHLIEKIEAAITPSISSSLDQLIEKDDASYQRPLLVRLKTINQSTKPGKIRESIRNFLIH